MKRRGFCLAVLFLAPILLLSAQPAPDARA
jgi:hypothetical protein